MFYISSHCRVALHWGTLYGHQVFSFHLWLTSFQIFLFTVKHSVQCIVQDFIDTLLRSSGQEPVNTLDVALTIVCVLTPLNNSPSAVQMICIYLHYEDQILTTVTAPHRASSADRIQYQFYFSDTIHQNHILN